MSTSLSANAITQFDLEVKHAYQGMGMLRPTVKLRTGVIGGTYRFPKMGKGTATPRSPQTDVVPMNVAHTKREAQITDWNAPEYTDIFDQQKVNYQERAELATTIAGAITRREDQLIIDALEASGTTKTVANDIGGTDTNLNVTKLRRSARLLDDDAVPMDRRCFLGSVVGKEALLGETEVTSSHFNTVRALVDGEINTFLGFNFKWMETRSEGGLSKDGSNDRTNFAYDYMAMGMAIGIDFRTEVNYIAEKTSWLANGLFAAGAVDVDNVGIVEVTTREA